VDVTNTGKCMGAEVLQIRVEHPAANQETPLLLRTVAKMELEPAECMAVNPRSCF
jgi:hypothetical protein